MVEADFLKMSSVADRLEVGEHARSRAELGLDVALDLARALVPEDVSRRLVVRAAEALDADRATLIRRTEDEVLVEAVHDRSGDGAEAGARGRLDAESSLFEAFQTGIAVRGGASLDSGIESDGGSRHMVALPLVFGGDVIGFLTVHRRRDAPFDDEDVATLQLIGNVAVVTLRNARLFAENRAARQAMADFLSVVMHEMRAPLTIVSGYMSMAREGVFGPTPDALSGPLATMELKLHEAQSLVDELLLASRLDDDRVPHRVVDVDLCDAAQRALERAEPRADLVGARVDVVAPRVAWARADAGHVDRILDNLVNNALVHGGPSVRVTLSAVGGPQPALVVTDNGSGVPEEERSRVFDRFYRGRDAGAGTGLGLYICKRLAEAWGGHVQLDEDGHPGARFVLHLPPAELTA